MNQPLQPTRANQPSHDKTAKNETLINQSVKNNLTDKRTLQAHGVFYAYKYAHEIPSQAIGLSFGSVYEPGDVVNAVTPLDASETHDATDTEKSTLTGAPCETTEVEPSTVINTSLQLDSSFLALTEDLMPVYNQLPTMQTLNPGENKPNITKIINTGENKSVNKESLNTGENKCMNESIHNTGENKNHIIKEPLYGARSKQYANVPLHSDADAINELENMDGRAHE